MTQSASTRMSKFICQLRLPLRVQEHESHNISLICRRPRQQIRRETLPQSPHKTQSYEYEHPFKYARVDEFLEAELLAAEMSIAGEKQLKQSLASFPLKYSWNGRFNDTGVQEFLISLSAIDVSSNKRVLGKIAHSYTVQHHHDLLTLKNISSVGGLILLILTILLSLFQVLHIAGIH